MANQSLDPNFNKYGYYDSLDDLKSWDPSSRDKLEDTITNYLTQIGVFSEPYQARYQARQIMGDPQAPDILSRIGYVDAMAGLAGTAGVPAFLAGLPAYLMAEDAYKAFERGNLKEGALNTGFAVLESLPMVGPVGDFVRNLREKLPDSEVGSMLGERLENSMRSMGALADMTEPTKQAKPTAKTDELGFYSALEEAGLNLNRKKGNGQSFMNDLLKSPNVKQDELDESGLTQFLAGKKDVTREEVQDFIANNRIQVEEVQLGDSYKEPTAALARGQRFGGNQFLMYDTQDNPLADDYLSAYPRLRNYFEEGQGVREGELEEIIYNDYDLYNKFMSDVYDRNPDLLTLPDDSAEYEAAFSSTAGDLLYDMEQALFRVVGPRDFNQEFSGAPRFATDSLTVAGSRSNDREILLTLPQREELIEGTRFMITNYDRELPIRSVRESIASTIPIFARTREEAIEQALEAGLDVGAVEEVMPEIQKTVFNPNFVTGHYAKDPSNVLAHIRVNDRVDSEGNPILFIEEIQSDWHSKGKKLGYGPQTRKTAYVYLESKNRAKPIILKDTAADTPEEALDKYKKGSDRAKYYDDNDYKVKVGQINELRTDKKLIPDAPFKENWYNLAIKRILKYAADKGYKRIGMTTAKQQQDRYDLTRVIDSIESYELDTISPSGLEEGKVVNVFPRGSDEPMTFFVNTDGKVVDVLKTPYQIERQVRDQDLSSVVGTDLADKIMDAEDDLLLNETDLKIGGKGMEQWYDNTYIKALNKLGKKYKTKVKKGSLTKGNVNEPTLKEHLDAYGYYEGTPKEIYKNILEDNGGEIPNWLSEEDALYLQLADDFDGLTAQRTTTDPIHVFDIPEEMRESLSGESGRQPLYSFGGGAGIGALSAFDEDDQILPVGP